MRATLTAGLGVRNAFRPATEGQWVAGRGGDRRGLKSPTEKSRVCAPPRNRAFPYNSVGGIHLTGGAQHRSPAMAEAVERRADEAELCAQQWGWPRGPLCRRRQRQPSPVASHYRAECPPRYRTKLAQQHDRSVVLRITSSADLPKQQSATPLRAAKWFHSTCWRQLTGSQAEVRRSKHRTPSLM